MFTSPPLRSLTATLAALTALTLCTPVHATVLASDDFNTGISGATVDGVSGGTGWSGAWAVTTSGTLDTSLANAFATTAGDSPMGGNALLIKGATSNNVTVTRTLTSTISADSVWIDYQFKFKAGNMNTGDALYFWVGANSTNSPHLGLYVNCGGSTTPTGCSVNNTLDLMVSMGNTTSAGKAAFTTPISSDQVYHLVGHLYKSTSGAANFYDRYDLWIDPTDTELRGNTGIDASVSAASNVKTFGTAGFYGFGLDPSPLDNVMVDNLRIGDAAPVQDLPAPGVLGLLGLGLAGLAGIRRERSAH